MSDPFAQTLHDIYSDNQHESLRYRNDEDTREVGIERYSQEYAPGEDDWFPSWFDSPLFDLRVRNEKHVRASRRLRAQPIRISACDRYPDESVPVNARSRAVPCTDADKEWFLTGLETSLLNPLSTRDRATSATLAAAPGCR